MPYTLNTSHALYGNLVELIGVESGALVSLKTARTFTKHANATFGSGAFGEHFTSLTAGYSVNGASFSPTLVLNTVANPNYTILIAFNNRETSYGSAGYLALAGSAYSLLSPSFNATNNARIMQGYTARANGTATLDTSSHSVAISSTGDSLAGGAKLYVDGVFDVSGGSTFNNVTAGIDYLGGYSGQGSVGMSMVWVAVFNKELSAAEILDLHNSLGASNAFGLIATGEAVTDATADGGVGSGTGSGSGGAAFGEGSAAADGGTGTGSGSGTGGDAVAAASGTFVSGELWSSGIRQIGVEVSWTWYPGAIGAEPSSALVHGSATTDVLGQATATGLPSGVGEFLAKTASGQFYYERGTVL